MTSELMLIGGRSGAGKSSVGFELHAQLSAVGVQHCLIEGDFLDMAFPNPWEHGLAERNLAAMWRNYRSLGYRRLIYTNTLCVLPEVADQLSAAMGDAPNVVAILLTCTDDTARKRLSEREIGSALEVHVNSSADASARLPSAVLESVHHVRTDDRTVTDIAAEVIDLANWLPARPNLD